MSLHMKIHITMVIYSIASMDAVWLNMRTSSLTTLRTHHLTFGGMMLTLLLHSRDQCMRILPTSPHRGTSNSKAEVVYKLSIVRNCCMASQVHMGGTFWKHKYFCLDSFGDLWNCRYMWTTSSKIKLYILV